MLGAVFDIDGTLLDSVDLRALAWQEAFTAFGHRVPFELSRGQIGKGGDQSLPVSHRLVCKHDGKLCSSSLSTGSLAVSSVSRTRNQALRQLCMPPPG